MPKIFVFTFVFIISACSSIEKEKSAEAEIQVNSRNLQVHLRPEHIGRTSRSPASLKTPNSTRRVRYFLALYTQFKDLERITNLELGLNHCPQFHHQILTTRFPKTQAKALESILNGRMDIYNTASLGLRLGERDLDEVFRDSAHLTSEQAPILRESLVNYNKENFEELKQLCDLGHSANYYAFENLVNHFETFDFTPKLSFMKAALKLPVVANILILRDFTQSRSDHEERVLGDLKFTWFKNYIEGIKGENNQVSLRR